MGEVLGPDVRTAPPASIARWLAVAAVLGALVGGVVVLGTGPASAAVPPSERWRADYDRGWVHLVEAQSADHRGDEISRAGCRWWVDGAGAALVGDRSVFVAGCDMAAQLTTLEAP